MSGHRYAIEQCKRVLKAVRKSLTHETLDRMTTHQRKQAFHQLLMIAEESVKDRELALKACGRMAEERDAARAEVAQLREQLAGGAARELTSGP